MGPIQDVGCGVGHGFGVEDQQGVLVSAVFRILQKKVESSAAAAGVLCRNMLCLQAKKRSDGLIALRVVAPLVENIPRPVKNPATLRFFLSLVQAGQDQAHAVSQQGCIAAHRKLRDGPFRQGDRKGGRGRAEQQSAVLYRQIPEVGPDNPLPELCYRAVFQIAGVDRKPAGIRLLFIFVHRAVEGGAVHCRVDVSGAVDAQQFLGTVGGAALQRLPIEHGSGLNVGVRHILSMDALIEHPFMDPKPGGAPAARRVRKTAELHDLGPVGAVRIDPVEDVAGQNVIQEIELPVPGRELNRRPEGSRIGTAVLAVVLALRLGAERKGLHRVQIQGQEHWDVGRAPVGEVQHVPDPGSLIPISSQKAVLIGQRLRERSRAFLVGRVCLLGAWLPAGSKEQKQSKGQSKQLFHM